MQLLVALAALAAAGAAGAVVSAGVLPPPGGRSPLQRWQHARRFRRRSTSPALPAVDPRP